jgi:hypothetical protein
LARSSSWLSPPRPCTTFDPKEDPRMKRRVNIRLPENVLRLAKSEADADPYADGKIAKVLRRIIADHYRGKSAPEVRKP